MTSPIQPRRHFLQIASSGAAVIALGCLGGCGSSDSVSNPTGDQEVGNVSSFPVGTLAFVGDRLVLGHDAGGFYAMTSVCTHESTNMATDGTISPTQVHCSNHGSNFDANGNVTKGPAGTGLQHYAVEIGTDGSITVHAGMVVDQSVRVAAPTA